MVKKIDSSRRSDAAAEIERAGAASEVGAVKEVKGATASAGAQRVRRPTRPMTAEERASLLSLVREEAEKMLTLPPTKRDSIEKAVLMALESGQIDEKKPDEGPEK
jgi:hypothetical protein